MSSKILFFHGIIGVFFLFPKSEQEWKNIAEDFKNHWNFDTCCGAIDGKHINTEKPPNSGSYYFNYKGKFSIVLLAIVNANYEFIMVHTGTNGKVSDGGVLQDTIFYDRLLKGSLNLPPPITPNGTQYTLPYTFVGDEAFPLHENLLKPYAQKGLTKEERIFNYRLSRARRIVENAFGIMAARFRIFNTDIKLDVKNIDTIILTFCVLHNFLRRSSKSYLTSTNVDQKNTDLGQIVAGEWRDDNFNLTALQRTPRSSTELAKKARNMYKKYFNNEGILNY